MCPWYISTLSIKKKIEFSLIWIKFYHSLSNGCFLIMITTDFVLIHFNSKSLLCLAIFYLISIEDLNQPWWCKCWSVRSESDGGRMFKPQPSRTKDFKTGTCCFLAWCSAFKKDRARTNNHRLATTAQDWWVWLPPVVKFLVRQLIILLNSV